MLIRAGWLMAQVKIQIGYLIKFKMPNEISTDQVLAFYRDIESGVIRLVAELDPQDVYAGDVVYRASNGWRLTVFNDANEFDYVDEVRTIDGRVTDYDFIDGTSADWSPDDEVAWQCLGIPGYMKFRCMVCGFKLPRATLRRRQSGQPFLCGDGRCAELRIPPMGTRIRILEV